ncbi:MAG TPA: hypothetical protein ENJ82_13145 [Bacteroidetes bacterium]|nr:hypothetical protein [Bacteroidota bacterium]
MQKSFLGLGLFLVLGLIFQGCAYNKLEILEKGDLCFESEILPIFVSRCSAPGCHNPQDKVEDRDYTSYQGIMVDVKKGKPGLSKIVTVMKGFSEEPMPPAPSPRVPNAEIATIEAWIKAGAKEAVGCLKPVPCDSVTNISFAAKVEPILSTYCVGCHGSAAPSGGITLDSYQTVLTSANNGGLLGSINGNVSFVQMPFNSSPLSDCEIATVRIWIEEGAQNN